MRFLKVGGVVLGALVITTLGISASDVLNDNAGSLLGQVFGTSQENGCPSGMVEVLVGQTFSCVDVFEASSADSCPVQEVTSGVQTQENLNVRDCTAVSRSEVKPWTNVTREQAQVLCLRAGKRLPSAAEWYVFALGTPDNESCNTTSQSLGDTGGNPQCISAVGVQDTIGNVWEWTNDDVIDGVYKGRVLPEEGYVTQVATDGVATVTSINELDQFSSDYIWTNSSGAFGLLRGGFYGSGKDAGVYSIHAKTLPTASTVAIGFRCVL